MHEEITQKKNVTGYASSIKFIDGEPTDEECFQVYVERKEPKSDLSEEDLIPEEYDGKPTDVVEVGEITLLDHFNVDSHIYPDRHSSVFDPICAGIQIHHVDHNGAGTIGSPPIENEDGIVGFLSNEHVVAPSAVSPEQGDEIYQGHNDRLIGNLYSFSNRENQGEKATNDDAFVEIEDIDKWSDRILGVGKLNGWKFDEDIDVLDTMVKSGRTTSVTSGRLLSKESSITVTIGEDEDGNRIRQEFGPVHSHQLAGGGGDSGSLIGTYDEGFYGTSLLFAGGINMMYGIPIEAIFEKHGELNPIGLDDHTEPDKYENGFEEGYDEGYGEGFDDGYYSGEQKDCDECEECPSGLIELIRYILQR